MFYVPFTQRERASPVSTAGASTGWLLRRHVRLACPAVRAVRRRWCPGAVLAGVLLTTAACDGGPTSVGATTAPTTTAPTTTVPTTIVPTTTVPTTTVDVGVGVATEAVFGSLLGFLSAYTSIGPAVTPGTEAFALTTDSVTRGTIATGEEAFVSASGIPGGIIGGTLDDDEAVTAVFVFVDPATPAAGTAVLSLVAATVASRAAFDQPAFVQAYGDLTADLAGRAGEQRWQPTTNGSGHSLVTTVVEGVGGGNLIEVAIVPFAGEAEARAAVKPLRNQVIGLLAE